MTLDDTVLRVAVFASLLALLIALEWLRPWREVAGNAVRRIDNVALLVLGTALLRLAFPLLALDVAFIAQGRGWGLLPALGVGGLAAGIIGCFALDLAVYVQHRVMHGVPLLWRLHAVHHADTQLDVTTGLRFHPLELAVSMLWKMAVVALVGPGPVAVLAFEILLNAGSMFSHSNIRLGPGLDRVLRSVLVTPAMHRVHHSVSREECDSNFGFSFSCWDRVFGTYRDCAARQEAVVFGAPGSAAPATGVAGLLAAPFRSKRTL
jgi:sterol desaturase/sphingolipid hydroxylase (fatty acid hydroxylase superfamily)